MAELPPLFKRCSKYPCKVDNRQENDDGYTPSHRPRRRCRRWNRAFELCVSLETLLETKDSAEILFDFLNAPYPSCNASHAGGEDEDDDDDYYDEYYDDDSDIPGVIDRSKIVWISDDVFMFTVCACFSHTHFREYLDHGADKLFSIHLNKDSDMIWIIQKPSLAAKRTPLKSDSTSPLLVDVMDVLLRLLARHKNITSLDLEMAALSDDGVAEFPSSLEALKAFVSEAQSARMIGLQNARLSQVQWNTITSNCNRNVTIKIVYYFFEDGRRNPDLQVNAIINHCPAKIKLCGVEYAPADKRQLLLRALESTTTLDELNVVFSYENMESILACIDAITQNHHLRKLGLKFGFCFDGLELIVGHVPLDLALGEWERFCGTIAAHPTLQEVQVSCWDSSDEFSIDPARSAEKDEILIRMIRQNTILCEFTMDHMMLYNGDRFDRDVTPVLALNRMRRVIQAIKQEANLVLRQQMFTATLFSNRVCQCPVHFYLLLKENVDMLEQGPCTMAG